MSATKPEGVAGIAALGIIPEMKSVAKPDIDDFSEFGLKMEITSGISRNYPVQTGCF
jgi:hypothetical protein